ncbi:MAG: nucleotidyltransferase family protein [Oligoflexales bacterium]|nr:nucleotidyltransferase family protein [Oligoflexales bacterium]
MITAIILASGYSRRFGKNKLLHRMDDRPIILNVAELVIRLGFDDAILVYQDEEVKEAVPPGIRCIRNPNAAEGISSSIRCGIDAASSPSAYIFFMGDQPFLDEDCVKKVVDAFNEKKGSIIVPLYEGKRGNPVLFDASWKESLKKISGDAGGRVLIDENPGRVFFVETGSKIAGFDIDTMEDCNTGPGRVP